MPRGFKPWVTDGEYGMEVIKGKYEVLKVIRDVVLDCLVSAGEFTLDGSEKVCKWECMEANQPAIKNLPNVVTLKMVSSKPAFRPYSEYDSVKGTRTDIWNEEQTWEVAVLQSRKTTPVTSTTTTAEDVAHILAMWMNTRAINHFRKNNMANLFVGLASIKSYDDDSNVNQNKSSFELKVQVPRTFTTEYGFARPKLEDVVEV